MYDLLLFTHIGMGDHIIFNGLTRILSKNKKTALICRPKYYNNICMMYQDSPHITPISLPQELDSTVPETKHQSFLDTIDAKQSILIPTKGHHFDKKAYQKVGIDYKYSFEYFYYDRNYYQELQLYQKLNPDNLKYAFIHNRSSKRSFNKEDIDNSLFKIYADATTSILYYGFVIQNATQIYCYNSAFANLVDRIPTNGQLFYKNTRSTVTQNKKWIQTNY